MLAFGFANWSHYGDSYYSSFWYFFPLQMINFEIVCGIVGLSQAVGAYGAPQGNHHSHRGHKTGGIASCIAILLVFLCSIVFSCTNGNIVLLYLYMSRLPWAILFVLASCRLLSGFKMGVFHHEFPSSSKCLGKIGVLLIAAGYCLDFVYCLITYYTGLSSYQGLFLLIIASMVQAGVLLMCICMIMKSLSAQHQQSYDSHHEQQHMQVDTKTLSDLKP